ncbi:MAG TPA: hypothetical protein VGV12_04610 [Gemmatimonadales bacterium]|nr:hypothetical protein [Gemmatimonadales bacterium]
MRMTVRLRIDPGFRGHLLELGERHSRVLGWRERCAVLLLRGTLENSGDLLVVEPAPGPEIIRHGARI